MIPYDSVLARWYPRLWCPRYVPTKAYCAFRLHLALHHTLTCLTLSFPYQQIYLAHHQGKLSTNGGRRTSSAVSKIVALLDAVASIEEKSAVSSTLIENRNVATSVAHRIQKRFTERLAGEYKCRGITIPNKFYLSLKATMIPKRIKVNSFDMEDALKKALTKTERDQLDTIGPFRVTVDSPSKRQKTWGSWISFRGNAG